MAIESDCYIQLFDICNIWRGGSKTMSKVLLTYLYPLCMLDTVATDLEIMIKLTDAIVASGDFSQQHGFRI